MTKPEMFKNINRAIKNHGSALAVATPSGEAYRALVAAVTRGQGDVTECLEAASTKLEAYVLDQNRRDEFYLNADMASAEKAKGLQIVANMRELRTLILDDRNLVVDFSWDGVSYQTTLPL